MRVKLVAGNWKMNGSLASSQAWIRAILPPVAALPTGPVSRFAPHIRISPPSARLVQGSNVALGAQDLAGLTTGHTGAVSGAMLADCGCRYAIVGHPSAAGSSGETDDAASRRDSAQALKHGLTPILCVGRDAGAARGGRDGSVVGRQLDAVVAALRVPRRSRQRCSPTSRSGRSAPGRTPRRSRRRTCTRSCAGASRRATKRSRRRCTILYGGSVKPGTQRSCSRCRTSTAGLIGGASLVGGGFHRDLRARAARSTANMI